MGSETQRVKDFENDPQNRTMEHEKSSQGQRGSYSRNKDVVNNTKKDLIDNFKQNR